MTPGKLYDAIDYVQPKQNIVPRFDVPGIEKFNLVKNRNEGNPVMTTETAQSPSMHFQLRSKELRETGTIQGIIGIGDDRCPLG